MILSDRFTILTRMAILHFPKHPAQFLDFTLTSPPRKKNTDSLVIYVHGFASHQRGEKVQYFKEKFLEAGMAFLAFDHRGHGTSSGKMIDLTVTHNLEDLDLLVGVHRKNYKNLFLVGSSMGGQTSAWFANQHPEIITANLLIAPGFRFLQNRMRDFGPEGLEVLKKKGKITIKNEWVEITIGKTLLDDARGYPMERLVKTYRTPTLILHGTHDDTVPFQDSVSFSRMSHARPLELVLIGGGDHRLTAHKDALFSYMSAFLKKENF